MSAPSAVSGPRERLLDGIPVHTIRLQLAGISTSVLQGGAGRPLVLLHGPSEHAAKWFPILSELSATHRVIAPDLPGHGDTDVGEDELDASRVLTWLGELIDHTCDVPPVVVGHVVGGAIAARFAALHPDRVARLVLVDTLGLVPLRPTPDFERALTGFLTRPDADTHDQLWEQCAYDRDRLRARLGEKWDWFRTYNVDQARSPGLQAPRQVLFAAFAQPAIAPEDLARIRVPTTLIWGRHDRATRVHVAESASARYGWPLHVIEEAADDPVMEQPEAFLDVLRATLRADVAATSPV